MSKIDSEYKLFELGLQAIRNRINAGEIHGALCTRSFKMKKLFGYRTIFQSGSEYVMTKIDLDNNTIDVSASPGNIITLSLSSESKLPLFSKYFTFREFMSRPNTNGAVQIVGEITIDND